jgi:glutamate-1-semialdehyde 2,1-aminomutase
MARASGLHPEGRGFEPCLAHLNPVTPRKLPKVFMLPANSEPDTCSALSPAYTNSPAESRSHMSQDSHSSELFQRAQNSIAGGVTSITRGTTIGWKPYPPFIEHGDGARLYDVDENEYIDYILGHGPLILGHRPPAVTAAVARAIQEYGALFALPYELEQKVAEKIRSHMPSMELSKFCNSGSEATHYAVRLARAVTGRDKIVKFEGQYHGWTDATEYSYHPAVKDLGTRSMPRTIPAAAGTPIEFARFVITQPWNDPETLSKTIRDHRHEIAAVITEPVMANCGVIPPEPGYLQFLREITRENDILLIFDEVITGLRVSLGGAQEAYGVRPDITVVGKALGAGFSVAGYGGSREVMEPVARDDVLHAGTFNGNVVAMSAAYAALCELEKPGVYENLEAVSDRLANGAREILSRAGHEVQVQRVASFFQIYFSPRPIHEYREAATYANLVKFRALHQALRARGVLVYPYGLGRWFLSSAHADRDIAKTLSALEDAAKELASDS